MGRAIGLREDFDGATLRRLAKVSKDAGQSRRLLALAEIYDGGARRSFGCRKRCPGPVRPPSCGRNGGRERRPARESARAGTGPGVASARRRLSEAPVSRNRRG